MSALYFSEICRLCLVKNGHLIPIFDGEGHVRRIFLQISTCLPLKMSRDDQLPKSICSECIWRVENQHQFWNTVLNAEKQLLDWLRCPPPQVQSGILQLPSIDIKPIQIPVEEGDLMNPDPAISQSLSCVETALEDEDEEVDADFEERELKPTTFVNVSLACDDTTSLDIPSISASETVDPVATSSDLQMAGSHDTPINCTCSYCDEAFSGVKLLVTHMASHEVSVYCCSKCKSIFTSQESSDSHVDICQAQDPLCCASLPSTVTSRKASIPEKKKPFVCPVNWCRQVYKVKANFSVHLETHQVIPSYKCRLCSHEFQSEGDYLHHEESCSPVHKPSKKKKKKIRLQTYYGCSKCDRRFENAYVRDTHVPCHGDEERPFACDLCDKKFKKRKVLEGHLLTHAAVKAIACDKCDYRCANNFQLRNHILNKHSDKRDFVCDTCGTAMATLHALKKHQEIHGERKHKCDLCERAFYNKADLRKHGITHDPNPPKPHLCDLCGKSFLDKYRLSSHMQRHSGEDIHKCSVCQKVVTTAKSLIIHLRRHTGEKPFVCEVCQKPFASGGLLRVHRLVHTGEKPHKCMECGKCFSQRPTLNVHMRSHSGLRPYACEVCPKAFVTKTLLTTHCKKHSH